MTVYKKTDGEHTLNVRHIQQTYTHRDTLIKKKKKKREIIRRKKKKLPLWQVREKEPNKRTNRQKGRLKDKQAYTEINTDREKGRPKEKQTEPEIKIEIKRMKSKKSKEKVTPNRETGYENQLQFLVNKKRTRIFPQ